MRAMTTEMVSMKYTSILWKDFGPYRGLGYVLIVDPLQEKLPLYLAFFEFIHNAKRRGKAALGALMTTLLQPALSA
ncbi:MAG: hypothetical protein MZV65_21580 [Chromatiales bacterium]|nr:hypothetical protein [Chromatiales bacterium]